jgi:hypothetical protein
MVKTGAQKAPANAGIVYLPVGNQIPRDILTWYDYSTYRIWVHNRNTGSGFKQLAVEVQHSSEIGQKVSPLEVSARLELAKLRTSVDESPAVTPRSFREIPIGRILEQHAKLISHHARKQAKKDKQQIRLVKDYELSTYTLELQPTEQHAKFEQMTINREPKNRNDIPARTENLELRATARDSIFIAFVYAEQVKAGSRQPALVTAQLLGIKVTLVYIAVRTSRKKNWLTSAGQQGAPIGVLTAEGEAEYKRINGESLYMKHITKVFKEEK